jgi:hypothetical protein
MLLLSESATRSVISAYAVVSVEFGNELGPRKLVLPNGDFFPDVFRGDGASARALVRRMLTHAGMLDIPIRTQVLGEDSPSNCSTTGGGGCGTGCGASGLATETETGLVDLGEEWELTLSQEDLRHPVALTTRLARVLGTVFLVETQRKNAPRELEPAVLVDLLAVRLGFGALLLEGAYVYSKSCGGPNVAKLTRLDVGELALSVALFAANDSRALRQARRYLGTTQRAALAEARDWLSGNGELVEKLAKAPELLIAGVFDVGAPRSSWLSWFERTSTKPTPPRALAKSNPRAPIDDGLAELVEETLAERG